MFTGLQRPDTAWGFDYEPTPFVHVKDRVTLGLAQLGAGCHVRDGPPLVELYQDPTEDWRELVTRTWED